MKKLYFFLTVLVMSHVSSASYAMQPVVTDSRIKTFVYNEYDVYNIYTQYGYQTNIEFGRDEEIVTISVGDRIAWQIIPVNNRLFIRPMEENARTNMTIITTEHAYQFDLSSSGSGELKPSEELSYVVRFYYPKEDARLTLSPPVQPEQMHAAMELPQESYNYAYTFSGPDAFAPLKVYDDGNQTYVKLGSASMPEFFALGADGKEYPVQTRQSTGGIVVIDTVLPVLVLRYDSNTFILIYNEKI